MSDNAAVLREPGNYVGGWVDGSKVYLDVTKLYPKDQREAAIRAGHEKNQISIADMSKIYEKDFKNAITAAAWSTRTPSPRKHLNKQEKVSSALGMNVQLLVPPFPI